MSPHQVPSITQLGEKEREYIQLREKEREINKDLI